MKLLTTYSIIVILLLPSNKLIHCQYANGRRQKYCKALGYSLPIYPCLKANYNLQSKRCNGKLKSEISDCLKCEERNNTIPFPYPRFVPVCFTQCPPEQIWCEPQQKCIDQNQTCDCGAEKTYCTYIDKDKIEHIRGKDVKVHGTTEKYRCFSSKELEKRKNNNEFEICDDDSCKETYMNCSGSTTNVSPGTRIVNRNNSEVDAWLNNGSENTTVEKFVNSTTTNESSPSKLGLSVGLSVAFVLLLGIGWAAGLTYYCRLKRKQDETMWVDDNPDYGEVEDYDEATVVTDVNDYYGKDDDSEEETALVDLNDNYGRLTVSVGNRDARLEFIEEVSSEDNDDEKENQRESVFYDEVSQKSQENDYD